MYLAALVQRGILVRETRRFLGLFPYHRHPAGPQNYAGAVRERFTAAERAGFPDHRSRALAALVAAAGLEPHVTGGERRSRSAMRSLVRELWPADAVRRNVVQDKSDESGGAGGTSRWAPAGLEVSAPISAPFGVDLDLTVIASHRRATASE